ncbi:MAG TPA: NAD(+) synthase, partial [Ideonella sp.]|nr:NAD(+) synthase [Ideonella sp.]
MPRNRVADPVFNAEQTVALHAQGAAEGAALVVFPELGLSGYTCDDLFHQQALLRASEAALLRVAEACRGHDTLAIVGLPLQVDQALFNCAAVVQRGKVLGIVPKTYLPNYGEFYEARQFNPAANARSSSVMLGGLAVPFGNDLLFEAAGQPLLKLHLEICEDLWVPIPPSSHAALAGASVLINLSASNITIGKAAYRSALVKQQSARCLAAYLYSSAGIGESTTDLAWDGQSLIYECGDLLRESARFATDSHLITADVDLERLSQERMRQTSFGAQVARFQGEVARFRNVEFAWPAARASGAHGALQRRVERFPYVPAAAARRDERCQEVYDIQVQGLAQRIAATDIQKLVIGISGGLDSTQALLVCARAMDALGLPRSHILGYTMPGYATSSRTLE